MRVFASDHSAHTPTMIERWRRVDTEQPLLDSASAVCDAASRSACAFIDAVAEFNSRLLFLDTAHGIGIASPAQRTLAEQARGIEQQYGARLVFKQSGAGGGDLGIALSDSCEAMREFTHIAVQSGLTKLDVTVDTGGVRRE